MLKIGVLGAARIVPWALMEPVARRDDLKVVAIAARRAGAAKAFAERHGIAGVHEHYEEVLADPSVDLIYNALPPHLHAELSIKALEAGKDVLCEKPFAMNAGEARRMNEAAARAGRRIIEAFHDRYHPVFLHLLDCANSGQIGKDQDAPRRVQSHHSARPHRVPPNSGDGRGCAHGPRLLPSPLVPLVAGEEPEIVEASAAVDADGYDEEMRATLAFPSGVDAAYRMCDVAGLAISRALHDRGRTRHIGGGKQPSAAPGSLDPGDDRRRSHQYTIGGGTTFDYQLAAIVSALEDGTLLPTEGADPVGNMTTIDAIYAKADIRR